MSIEQKAKDFRAEPGSTQALMGLIVKPGHMQATRTLGHALTLGDADAWASASAVFKLLLTTDERGALTASALRSMGREQAILVAEAVFRSDACKPVAPLFGFMDEAAHWADMACTAELKAYALACFNRMPPADQAAFMSHVQGRTAA